MFDIKNISNKKAQGLPIRTVIVIIIAIIILAIVALFAMGIIGEGFELSSLFLDSGENMTENATDAIEEHLGRHT